MTDVQPTLIAACAAAKRPTLINRQLARASRLAAPRPLAPKLLILDEPTLGLAPVILEQLSKTLERLRQTTGITVLLGEQNVTFALPHSDRVYMLEHARIVWEGEPAKFAADAGIGYL